MKILWTVWTCLLSAKGWTDFTAAANIGQESVLLIKVEPTQEYIGLNVVEIIH